MSNNVNLAAIQKQIELSQAVINQSRELTQKVNSSLDKVGSDLAAGLVYMLEGQESILQELRMMRLEVEYMKHIMPK